MTSVINVIKLAITHVIVQSEQGKEALPVIDNDIVTLKTVDASTARRQVIKNRDAQKNDQTVLTEIAIIGRDLLDIMIGDT